MPLYEEPIHATPMKLDCIAKVQTNLNRQTSKTHSRLQAETEPSGKKEKG